MCKSLVVGIDPGSDIVGMVVLTDMRIEQAFNLEIAAFWGKIEALTRYSELTVVIEDLAPYSLRLTPQVIDTAKFIGEAVFRLKQYSNVKVVLIPRSKVKMWVWENFLDLVRPLIDSKIDKKLFPACKIDDRTEIRVDDRGKPARKGSFIYVDDKIVKAAMVHLYQIPKPPPGAGYIHGIKDHAWQALACASVFTGKIS
jgi:hypothetical protein